jgi:hypothetical protein
LAFEAVTVALVAADAAADAIRRPETRQANTMVARRPPRAPAVMRLAPS